MTLCIYLLTYSLTYIPVDDSIYLSICLSVCLSIRPVNLPACLPACLSVCLSVCRSRYIHIYSYMRRHELYFLQHDSMTVSRTTSTVQLHLRPFQESVQKRDRPGLVAVDGLASCRGGRRVCDTPWTKSQVCLKSSV